MKRIELLAAMVLSFVNIPAQDGSGNSSILTDTSGSKHPWNHLRTNSSPGNFQFAIVADRTGGHRPGIFEDAVRKLNLLQPELVVSMGDLIEGYTRESEMINREWDEFNGIIGQLEMPFFYLPGNHDYTNDVMAGIWKERYGPSYYHFLYRDVLFLFLNSEEAMKGSGLGGIEQAQYLYVKNVLEEYRDARWTLVFMHQPLWLLDSAGYWKDIESLLGDRKHTVFAGHNHRYVKYERDSSNYFMLATTGGISKLRGPNFGEFDQLVWITMTGEGPVIANLILAGIWDENVVTEELSRMIGSERIQIEPLFVDDGFREGKFRIKISNDANYSMWTVLRFGESQYLSPEILEYQKTVPPNSEAMLDIPVHERPVTSLRYIEPIPLYVWYIYKYEGGREIKLDQQFGLAPVRKNYLNKSEVPITVDGDPGEWTGLPHRAGLESVITEGRDNYLGDYDAHFDFNLTFDDDNLYLAMAVWDDELELDRQASLWSQDAVLINLDPRPVLISSNDHSDNRYRNNYFYLNCAPSLARNQSPLIEQEELLPEGTRIATRKSVEGFTLELSIPLDYIRQLGGGDWSTVRLNIAYFDRDGKDPRSAIWWKPNWSSDENYIGSGMFFRTRVE